MLSGTAAGHACARSRVRRSPQNGLHSRPPSRDTVHLTVDTDTPIDNPDLVASTAHIGPRHMAHLLPVVLRELDDKKRAGQADNLREAPRKADLRRKGLRTNRDVTLRVAGDVHAVFEYVQP